MTANGPVFLTTRPPGRQERDMLICPNATRRRAIQSPRGLSPLIASRPPRPRAPLCKLAIIDYADHCIPTSYVVFRVCKRARQLCKLASSPSPLASVQLTSTWWRAGRILLIRCQSPLPIHDRFPEEQVGKTWCAVRASLRTVLDPWRRGQRRGALLAIVRTGTAALSQVSRPRAGAAGEAPPTRQPRA